MNKKKEKSGLLTASEQKVMNILWSMPDASAMGQQIQDGFPEPKPAYTTTLTFLKILEDKGFVSSEKEGRCTRFRAVVSKDEYTDRAMEDVKTNFFGGSMSRLVSYFVKREKLSSDELDEIISLIEKGSSTNEK